MKHIQLFEAFMGSSKSVVEIAAGSPDHKTLVAAVKAAELIPTLSGQGPFTIFAPTDKAFAQLPAGTVDGLLKPENADKLTSVLTNHVVKGKVMSGDLMDGQVIKTLGGGELKVSIRNGVVKINDVVVSTPDLDGTNGVIHVVDGVILP